MLVLVSFIMPTAKIKHLPYSLYICEFEIYFPYQCGGGASFKNRVKINASKVYSMATEQKKF